MARALRSLHFRGKSRRRAAGRAGGSEDKIHPERAEQGEGGIWSAGGRDSLKPESVSGRGRGHRLRNRL